jgi:hypothetical protein
MKKLFFCVGILLACKSTYALAASPFSYAAWEANGPNSFMTSTAGIGGTLSFGTSGDDHLFRNDIPATAGDFVAQYGSLVEAIKFDSGVAGSSASAEAHVQLNSPLPAGSRLLAFDLDVILRNERFQISRDVGSLVLVDQLESQAGGNSHFPTWSSSTGVLAAQGTSGANDEEVTVFDVSGVQSLTIVYSLRARTTGGVAGASFAIGVPVPEAPGVSLMAIGLISILTVSLTSRCH